MKVNVKWGKQVFKDVEVDMEQPPEMLKMQLYSLTGVPSERQKVMVKGGLLKNDTWAKVKLQDGATINMIGTAEQLPVSQPEEAKFLEDLPEDVCCDTSTMHAWSLRHGGVHL
jgi:ubiquitin carboxyl-terminal hydrolase 14